MHPAERTKQNDAPRQPQSDAAEAHWHTLLRDFLACVALGMPERARAKLDELFGLFRPGTHDEKVLSQWAKGKNLTDLVVCFTTVAKVTGGDRVAAE